MSGLPVADKLLSMSAGEHMQEAERHAELAAADPTDAGVSQAHSLCAITQLVHRGALALEAQVAELRSQTPLRDQERRRVRMDARRAAWDMVRDRLRDWTVEEGDVTAMQALFAQLAQESGDVQEFPL